MNELSRLYADASFRSGDYRCHNCHRIFKQTNRYQTMCSSSCENEYMMRKERIMENEW